MNDYGTSCGAIMDDGDGVRAAVESHCNGDNMLRQHQLVASLSCETTVATFNMTDFPELAGKPVYFAFEAQLEPATAQLSLVIAFESDATGKLQSHWSNSSSGVSCNRALGPSCSSGAGASITPS